MSSISLDASGQRGITNTINDPARTFSSIQTKGDDDLSVYVGNAGEVSVALPLSAKVKHLKDKNGNETYYLKLDGFLNATIYNGRHKDGSATGPFPHATVRAIKDIENPWADAEVLREVTVGELLGIEMESEGEES